ncbi:efflux RND transporter periplasmic adaptor subunit [Actinomadura scrupuli]|uniref:efflux RND transporter periplasmic adaptor subunit n=1 Tax=Actinomadura scrupuli TaxID=559629 RepID=UPI003D98C97F
MKPLFERRAFLVNGALGVLLAGGIGFAYVSLTDQGANAGATTRTSQVTRGTVRSSVSASGSVESAVTRSLSFGTSGTVTKIYVKVGQKVAKGKVLARLDQTAAMESVNAAKAALAVAADGDTSTAQGYSGYVSAKNSYNNAVRQLAGTVLTAPIAGTVTALNGSVGGSSSGSASSSASSGSSGSAGSSGSGSSGTGGSSSGSGSTSSASSGFLELSDTARLKVTGQFTEADTTKLKTGQPATVTFDALTDVTATGKVGAIDVSPTTSGNVVQYGVTITLTSRPSSVRIGQTATVVISTGSKSGVLYVPSAAVRTAGGQSTVTVLTNGEQVTRTVRIGMKGDTGTEITSGLAEGEQVVITTGTGGTATTSGGGLPGGGGGVPGGGGGVPGGGRP